MPGVGLDDPREGPLKLYDFMNLQVQIACGGTHYNCFVIKLSIDLVKYNVFNVCHINEKGRQFYISSPGTEYERRVY